MDIRNEADTPLREDDQTLPTWTAIAEQYRHLMILWAARCAAMPLSGECAEAIADQALTRAWLALSKGTATFPNRAAFLAYLRTCVTHTAIDAARAQTAQARPVHSLPSEASMCPEQLLLEQLDRTELWRTIYTLITTEQERIVLIERYVLDIPPRHILTRHPTLFADVASIYRTVRNLCDRLEHNAQLRQLWEEYTGA